MTAVTVLLIVIATIVLIPSAVYFFECFVAALPGKTRSDATAEPVPRIAILVPAHDEEASIGDTVTALLQDLAGAPGARLVVIADNCSDQTAAAARAAGAEVIERRDPSKRGKGFALAFGTEHLKQDPPDVVIIVDADCRVSAGTLVSIARDALRSGRPVQAEYLLSSPSDKPAARISAFAFLVRNRVRPLGMHRLGLPCHLTGSGMAFPWPVYRDAPPTGAYLVEDLLMGLELAERGTPPLLAPEAHVTSVLPDKAKAAMGQRRRWEHGQLATLFRHGPKLVLLGLARLRLDLFSLGLDLMVPPLALLVLGIFAVTALMAVAAFFGLSIVPLAISGTALLLVLAGTGLAWISEGRKVLPFKQLLAIPFYVAWKIPLYASFFFKGGQKTWERTERTQPPPGPADRK